MRYPRPTDLEVAFRELKRLRIKVAKAEAWGDRDNDDAPWRIVLGG
jgi:hypothetical protein